MDSSVSSDPFAADSDFTDERAQRCKRRAIGAVGDEIRYLRAVPNFDEISDADLRAKLDAYRAGEPAVVPEPVDEPDEEQQAQLAALEAEQAAQREDAVRGEWVPSDDVVVDGAVYKGWTLEHGWVGTLVGDIQNGVHLVAPTVELLISEVRELLARQSDRAQRLAAWQAQKHANDAKARAAS